MRKRLASAFLLAIVLLCCPQMAKANDAEIQKLIQDFFYNVGHGYGRSAMAFMTDPLLSAKRAQLKDNPGYSRFLRKIYANSSVEVTGINTLNDDAKTVDVEIYYKDEAVPQKVRYVLINEAGRWKISEEIVPY